MNTRKWEFTDIRTDPMHILSDDELYVMQSLGYAGSITLSLMYNVRTGLSMD